MEQVISFGGEIKALGNGKVGGYLVLFGDPTKTDLVGDFFTPNTDFDLERSNKTTIYYNHGLDPTIKSRKLGVGEMKVTDVGVWLEAQLEDRDEYDKAIYGLAQKGKLGWSSGTAAHLVERKTVGNTTEILSWALGLDASLTTTPCEPRTAAMPLKTWEMECKSHPIKLYDPLEEIEDSCLSSALSRLNDALWYAMSQIAYDEDSTIEEKITFFKDTCAGISEKGEKIIRALGETPEEELAEAKALLDRRGRMSAKDVRSERDFERHLREAGFAREAAKALTAKGYKGLHQREVEEIAEVTTPNRNGAYYAAKLAMLNMED